MEKLHRINIKANAPQNKCLVDIQNGKIGQLVGNWSFFMNIPKQAAQMMA